MRKMFDLFVWNVKYIVMYKIVYAFLFVVLVWSVVINTVGKNYRETMIPFVLFIDLAIIGFYFIGAMILLEKSDRTVYAVMCTPLKKNEFLVNKIFTFTILSLVLSFLLVLTCAGDCHMNVYLLCLGVIMCSINYSILGLIAIVQYDSLTDYLLPSWIYLFFTQLPLLNFFEVTPDSLFLRFIFDLLPTAAPLNIMKMAFKGILFPEMIISFASYLIWIVILYHVMMKRFEKYIVEN